MHATGPFEVTMTPQSGGDPVPDPQRARFLLAKHYHGDLVATAAGEMLSGGDPKTGSAGYVAIERVTGTLDGREGSFLLQHSGTMPAGRFDLSVTVIPGSGTAALAGLAGSLQIEAAAGGQHAYSFDYSLPGIA